MKQRVFFEKLIVVQSFNILCTCADLCELTDMRLGINNFKNVSSVHIT